MSLQAPYTSELEPPEAACPAPPSAGARTAGTVVLACIAACCALYFGRLFFVPIVFAVLLNALLRPIVRGLEKMRVPTSAGGAIVVLGTMAMLAAVGFGLAGPLQTWLQKAPESFAVAEAKLNRVRNQFQQMAEVATKIEHATTQGPTTAPTIAAPVPAPATPGWADRLVGGTTKFVSGLLEVLLLLYLLLAAGDLFFQKLIKVIPLWQDKKAAAQVVRESQSVVMRYMLVNAFINAGQGVVVGLALWAMGMPNPLLWGVFTFVLEFIPYLGAAVMIGLLSVIAFATFDNVGHILLVPASYLVITTLQNNIVSPIAYGQHLKLNPVAVFIGVIFWWFLWGIPGAFLAVPIVAMVKIISDHVEPLAPIGEFLGE